MIAIFYTAKVSLIALGASLVFLAGIAALDRFGVRQNRVYVFTATGAWACVLASSVHATVAGILVAMLVPVRSKLDPGSFIERARDALRSLEGEELSPRSPLDDPAPMRALHRARAVDRGPTP